MFNIARTPPERLIEVQVIQQRMFVWALGEIYGQRRMASCSGLRACTWNDRRWMIFN
jgi:hypothetical protein